MANRSDSSKHTSRIILVIAGLLVLTSLGYFAFQYFSQKQQNEANIIKVEDLNNEILGLEERILDFEMTMDEKDMDLSEKQRLIEEKKIELQRLSAMLQQSKQNDRANLAKVKDLEQRLEMSNRLLGQYTDELEALKQENTQLTGQVASLQETQGELRAHNLSLRQQQDSTLQALNETTELASALKARDFRVMRLGRNREVEKEEFRKWSMRDLRVCFTLLENSVAQAGRRTVYLVYENPDGSINTNDDSGTFNYQGRSRTYSVKTDVDYRNLSQESCLDFIRPDGFDYQKGPQYLSVYTEGNLLGQGSFEIK
jgi:myosin heavy subunit